MVPPSTLAHYRAMDDAWDTDKLLTIEFMSLMREIKRDELNNQQLWNQFNQRLSLPPKGNKLISNEYDSCK